MKFIISSSLLQKQLQTVSGVMGSGSALPILENVLFEIEDKTLTLTASDLETSMSSRITVDMADGDIRVAIPGKIIMDTLKTLPDIPVSFTINENNHNVEISAGEGRYNTQGYPGDEFPKTPEIESEATISISTGALSKSIRKAIIATSNDNLRPMMNGIFCEIENEKATFVATDAHKLVKYTRNDVKADKDTSFILPKKPLNHLKNILPQDSEKIVVIRYNQTNASFIFENYTLVCRLIDGKYPNYQVAIPTNNPNVLVIDKMSFIQAIQRVSLYANQSTFQIRLKISGQELFLSAEDMDYAKEAKERLECQYDGDDLEIGFNSKFLQEILSNVDTDDIHFEMSEPSKAGIILPVGSDDKNEEILLLVMPVMLREDAGSDSDENDDKE